jgi:hypothetical protein
MRFGTLFGSRGVQIAAFVTAIGIAVFGNDALSGFGPGATGPKKESSECMEADSSAQEDSACASLNWFVEEIDGLGGVQEDETDQILAELFAQAQAPSEEPCPCVDAQDRASAGCACGERPDEIPSSIVTAGLIDGLGTGSSSKSTPLLASRRRTRRGPQSVPTPGSGRVRSTRRWCDRKPGPSYAQRRAPDGSDDGDLSRRDRPAVRLSSRRSAARPGRCLPLNRSPDGEAN